MTENALQLRVLGYQAYKVLLRRFSLTYLNFLPCQVQNFDAFPL